MKPVILVTGANGFIGRHLTAELEKQAYPVIKTCRKMPTCDEAFSSQLVQTEQKMFAIGDIDGDTQWSASLNNVDIVIHLAARVHIMREETGNALQIFRQVNTLGTMNLVRQAHAAGVKRFIYISTIKVNGEKTTDAPFSADDTPDPSEPYSISKYEAEKQLLAYAQETGMEVVIIRPPLVYGPAVKGNFLRLMKWVDKAIPLPLAKMNNKRSLVNIDNLCSLIKVCLVHEKAAGEILLVSDGQDVSTSELFEQLALAMRRKCRLFYVPVSLSRRLARVANRTAEYDRLFGSLQVDIEKNERLLDWKPEVSLQQGLLETVKWYENQ